MLLDDFYLTVPNPTSEEVEEWIQANAPQRSAPTWALVCVMLGAALVVGAGAFLITMGIVL